jgi:hypothetical protein
VLSALAALSGGRRAAGNAIEFKLDAYGGRQLRLNALAHGYGPQLWNTR